MLILTRRPGDTVFIEPRPGTNPSDAAEWFARPIEVRILRVDGRHVRIGIEAAEGLWIWRGERDGKGGGC
jgi:sRNA-binding carbon storage regulator CsrA